MSANVESNDIVTMICPNLACRKTVSAPTSSRGLTVRCAYCQTPFRVPMAPLRESTDAAQARDANRPKK